MPTLSRNKDLERLYWAYDYLGIPCKTAFNVLGELVDLNSVTGHSTRFGSTVFAITRIVTGQLDAYVDIRCRILQEHPEILSECQRLGRGNLVTIQPYDYAAAVLIAQEAGCIVTDTHGNSIEDAQIISPDLRDRKSLVVTASPELHKKILATLNF